MKFLHYLNAGLWFLNSVLWTFYAGSLFMGFASALAAVTAGYIGWREDAWT